MDNNNIQNNKPSTNTQNNDNSNPELLNQNITSNDLPNNENLITPTSTVQSNDDLITPTSTVQSNDDLITPTSIVQSNDDLITPTSSTMQSNDNLITPTSTVQSNDDLIIPTNTVQSNENLITPTSTVQSSNSLNNNNIINDIINDMDTSNISSTKTKKKSFKFICASIAVVFGLLGTAVGSSFLTANYILNQNHYNLDSASLPPVNENSPKLSISESASSDTSLPLSGEVEKLTIPQINVKVSPSVVGIQSDSIMGLSGIGTGIIMSDDGYIITNQHVVENSNILTVSLYDGEVYSAELIGADSKTDLAVLKIDPKEPLIPAEFGDSNALVVGDTAIAIGNPASLSLQGSLTGGLISAINRDMLVEDRIMTLIQTDAAINPGNSGGPLINEYGQVIGINTIKIASEEFEGLGFAIPINEAKPIIDELIAYGHVKGRPSIGISGQNITSEMSKYYNIPQGLLVQSVDYRSDAFAKGLKENDIITGVNGEDAFTSAEINDIKENFKAGDTITLSVFRAGKTLDIDIILMDEVDLQQPVVEQTPSNNWGYSDPESNFFFPFK